MTSVSTSDQKDSINPPPSVIEVPQTQLTKQIGNYTLGIEIGSGAFGKVVLGTHILTGETVAIKILDKLILSQTPEDYELVHQEIAILKIVKHKNIAQLYEIMETPQNIYIIMEYCEGKDLMDYILLKTRLGELESLKLFQQLINALLYLHSQNIAHRDIKIDNMLLDNKKNLKLVDFGLSTKYTDDELLNQPCGTVVYAAPEVLEGKEYHGMLADVWSSGIVLYGMLSGYLPFCDQDDEVNKQNVLKGDIEIPEFFSPLVKDLLSHMLDMNPMTRYTLQDIQDHAWFNRREAIMLPGIVIGENKIPVDERILNMIEAYGLEKNKVRESLINNKFDSGTSMYYLLVRKVKNQGFDSVSDMCSVEFVSFIIDDKNSIKKDDDSDSDKIEDSDNNGKSPDKEDRENTEKDISNGQDNRSENIDSNKKVLLTSIESGIKNEKEENTKENGISLSQTLPPVHSIIDKDPAINQNTFTTPPVNISKKKENTIPKLPLPLPKKKINTSREKKKSARPKSITPIKLSQSQKETGNLKKLVRPNIIPKNKLNSTKKEIKSKIFEDTLSTRKKRVPKSHSVSMCLPSTSKSKKNQNLPNHKKAIKSSSQPNLTNRKDSSKKHKYSNEDINKITSRLYTSYNSHLKGKIPLISKLNLSLQFEKAAKDQKIHTLRKANVRHLDSSVVQYRKKSPMSIRDLSYSPHQALLNEKSRIEKIPWKYKKKGIDSQQQNEAIYHKYQLTIIKNKKNKIQNKKKKVNISSVVFQNKHKNDSLSSILNKSSLTVKNDAQCNNYHISKSSSMKNYNKNSSPPKKEISLPKKRPIRIRSKNYNHLNTSTSSLTGTMTTIFIPLSLYEGPIDIQCISKENSSFDDSVKYLVTKLKKGEVSYIQTRQNKFRCTKNGVSFDIEIFRINTCNKGDILYYYKMKSTQGCIGSYRNFSHIIFG